MITEGGDRRAADDVALVPHRYLGRPCLHRYHRLVARIGSESPLIRPFWHVNVQTFAFLCGWILVYNLIRHFMSK